MYSEVHSTTIFGISAHIVTVETDVGFGLPVFEMSGYLANEVKESRERVRVAIKNSGQELKPQRIMVNISPADLRKDGTGFDLPIAIGILSANGIVVQDRLKETVILGELSLDGSVNAVNGVLPSVCEARDQHYKTCLVPADNLKEASVISGIRIYAVHNLREAIEYLNGERELTCVNEDKIERTVTCDESYDVDFLDIRGQQAAKRATLVAVAGMHNIMYIGAPGSGKTMMAKRIPTIMPSLSFEESIELTKIYSVAGMLKKENPMIKSRPFRSPHHNVTTSALIGGGRIPRPGEITLAGKGVLFLDEMTEYTPAIMESLRQPLEDKNITIVRLNYAYTYPADFMLAAAINPCKCGYYPDRNRCNCSEHDIQRYLGKISTPMWDRFDISIQVEPVRFADICEGQSEVIGKQNARKKESEKETRALKNEYEEYSSHNMKHKVDEARQIQLERFKGRKISFNSEMSSADVKRFCELGEKEKKLMDQVYTRLKLTGRGYHKILKTARTIADLEGESRIQIRHLSEAVSYRSYDPTIRS